MFAVFTRTIIIYMLLIITIRITGKRQVGEMQLSELITTFLISEVAAAPLTDGDIPLIYAIIPILLLTSLEIIISYVATKSFLLKKLFEGSPAILISRGKLNAHALDKQRISADELLSALRMKDATDISKLYYVFLEHNGQISAFTKEDGLTLPVIIDGRINFHFLNILDRDILWLRRELTKFQSNVNDIFIMTTDGITSNIIKKEK